MKNLTIKILLTLAIMFTVENELNAQFVNGFYNGEMTYQLPLCPFSTPFRGSTKPNNTEWDGPNLSDPSAYYPVLIVFVQFADDPEYAPFGSWPKGQSPIYLDSIIATTKNMSTTIPWWEKYNPNTEMISSQWMEISRGRFHVISPSPTGVGAFSVVLGNASEYTSEQQMNQAIWMDLHRQGLID